mmetsp:Transcript_11430/g.20678  ORF Transcript_11430/g.20678 Transcript_11430/m.20678 type:complete len:104 (-) Transcript_11430:123-434(-)|eukprot:CAMPEP_0177778302 /NCGR_PEP_ID=MMETSP0491_2-20121128/15874_1 /TAXON_ID=63592 /ORGANISM="Tetraselmis chuii, Strain PLY429" /LENGTH=103 /DNA_ID=CAMNT_0019297551 /DNA_START=111 /DNA_END=422 /DNA_ORIENTATION=+
MYAVASKSAVVTAKPVSARRNARSQVKVVGSAEQKREVAQRRTVFAGLAAAAAVVATAPKQARAENQAMNQGGQAGENDTEPVTRVCSEHPTSKVCQEEAAKR